MYAGDDGGRIHPELAKDPEGPRRWRCLVLARGAAGAPAAWGPCGTTHARMHGANTCLFLFSRFVYLFILCFMCLAPMAQPFHVPVHHIGAMHFPSVLQLPA